MFFCIQTDLTGTCDADYTVENNGWYSVTIKKHKNLLGCTKRNSVNTAIQGTPYNVPSVTIIQIIQLPDL